MAAIRGDPAQGSQAKTVAIINPRRAIYNIQAERPPSEERTTKVRLDMNENTAGPAPGVLRRLRNAVQATQLGAYPEYESARAELARHFNVRAEELLLTNGIDDALKLICDTFVDPGDSLLIPNLTFTMYQFFHSVAGGKTKVIHYDSKLRLPVHRALAALRAGPGRARVRWLALANPNNPTGTLIPKDDLRGLLRAAPGTLILVDEAYFDYSGETVLPWIRRYPNLIVARTFSKAHGLAGLRLGLLFARRGLTDWMRRAQAVFPVNSLALAAALAAINSPHDLRRHVSDVLEQRHRLCRCLDSLGVPYAPSAANFVFARFGPKAPEVARRLARQGILVRHWSRDPHLRPYFRVGIGTATEMRRVVRALEGLRSLIEPQDSALAWRGAARYSPLPTHG
ncbi:MAG TPA: histidinol-phosphate transaminase [Terriglobia bacterium]|nr:histidinol-phosphate transaminase [Terriglobia bacterium]